MDVATIEVYAGAVTITNGRGAVELEGTGWVVHSAVNDGARVSLVASRTERRSERGSGV